MAIYKEMAQFLLDAIEALEKLDQQYPADNDLFPYIQSADIYLAGEKIGRLVDGGTGWIFEEEEE